MGKLKKVLFLTFGAISLALGLIGILVPVLPTTPFLLLAAFFFTRSSERALHWLLNNRWLGAYIRNYREGRGMAALDKGLTLFMLWATILLSILFVLDSLWLRMLLVGIAGGVTFHLLRIPTYRPELPAAENIAETE